MKRKLVIFSLMSLITLTGIAQITIEDCYLKAQTNYPLIKQHDLIGKTEVYNLSNANKGYLPQIMFSAKATYQSEVTEIPISMPGVGGLSKDHYGATIEVSQTIWDGGAISARRESIRTASEIDSKNLEVNLYSINDRINQLYFGILLFDARIVQNKIFQNELKSNYEKVASYVQNGIANQADLDAIKVEQIKAQQTQIQLKYTKKAYLDMLSTMIGEQLTDDVILIKPEITSTNTYSINRPEMGVFNAQIKNLEAKRQEINSSMMPKLGAFVTGGYGRPGLNMLKNDFSSYYIAGIRLSWNISSLYTNKNSKRIIQNSINVIETQRETFLFNTKIDISKKKSDLDKFYDKLKYDDEIIALRSSIKKASESKMANGTLSGIDLIRDITAEDIAKQDKILHEIELLLAAYNLKFATNN